MCMLNFKSPLKCVKSEGEEHVEKKWGSFRVLIGSAEQAAHPNAYSGTAKNNKTAQSRFPSNSPDQTDSRHFLRRDAESRWLGCNGRMQTSGGLHRGGRLTLSKNADKPNETGKNNERSKKRKAKP